MISPRLPSRRGQSRGNTARSSSSRAVTMLFAAIWMMSSLSPVMGDTEIMQFHASPVEGGVKGVRDVVMLHEEISIKPNQVIRYDFQMQKDGETVRELLIDTGEGGWWFQDKYAVRLSWPANYPARFVMAVEPSSTRGKHILTISAQHRGVEIPSSSVLRRSHLASHQHVIPLNVALDQLVFGVVPVVAIRPALLVVIMIAVGWVLRYPALAILKSLVRDRNLKKKQI